MLLLKNISIMKIDDVCLNIIMFCIIIFSSFLTYGWLTYQDKEIDVEQTICTSLNCYLDLNLRAVKFNKYGIGHGTEPFSCSFCERNILRNNTNEIIQEKFNLETI